MTAGPQVPPTRRNKRILIAIISLSAVLAGAAMGLGGFTFFYANGTSYLSDRPEACANCHIMREVLQDWRKGDHHHVAVCNDCHVPQGFVGKWLVKGLNGFHHSYAFTFTNPPPNLRAAKLSRAVAQANCLRCHGDLMPTHGRPAAAGEAQGDTHDQPTCLSCHRQVGHFH